MRPRQKIGTDELLQLVGEIKFARLIARQMKAGGATDEQLRNFFFPVAYRAMEFVERRALQSPALRARRAKAATRAARSVKEEAALQGISRQALWKRRNKHKRTGKPTRKG